MGNTSSQGQMTIPRKQKRGRTAAATTFMPSTQPVSTQQGGVAALSKQPTVVDKPTPVLVAHAVLPAVAPPGSVVSGAIVTPTVPLHKPLPKTGSVTTPVISLPVTKASLPINPIAVAQVPLPINPTQRVAAAQQPAVYSSRIVNSSYIIKPNPTVAAPLTTVVKPNPTVVAPVTTTVAKPNPAVVAPVTTTVAKPNPAVVAPLTVAKPNPAVVAPVTLAVKTNSTVVAPMTLAVKSAPVTTLVPVMQVSAPPLIRTRPDISTMNGINTLPVQNPSEFNRILAPRAVRPAPFRWMSEPVTRPRSYPAYENDALNGGDDNRNNNTLIMPVSSNINRRVNFARMAPDPAPSPAPKPKGMSMSAGLKTLNDQYATFTPSRAGKNPIRLNIGFSRNAPNTPHQSRSTAIREF